jgi:P27 family predicted phage terminase small subunit
VRGAWLAVGNLVTDTLASPPVYAFGADNQRMGKRGPMPAPPSLKILSGTAPGRDSGGRVVAKTPAFERDEPTVPDWLDGAALDEWRRVVPTLTSLNLLKPEDGPLLVSYCLTWQEVSDLSAIIRAEGLLETNPSGRRVAHPAVLMRAAAIRDLRPLAQHFGLSPWSESNIAAASVPDAEDDPFAVGS